MGFTYEMNLNVNLIHDVQFFKHARHMFVKVTVFTLVNEYIHRFQMYFDNKRMLNSWDHKF